MHPSHFAKSKPDHPAYIMGGTGETVTFKQLEERSNQIAHLFREHGINAGDTIAIFAENSPRYFEIAWAAQRAGLYYVCISSRLTPPEVEYILSDSGSRIVIASASLSSVATEVNATTKLDAYWSIDGEIFGHQKLEDLCKDKPVTPISDEMMGTDMLYSSGTTGRPKGIRPPLERDIPIDEPSVLVQLAQLLAKAQGDDMVYLSPAPLYHAAPLRWCMSFTRMGATLVIMEKFDPEKYLQLVEKYKVTHTQLVPTMFVKMLKLPKDVREKYDVSSLRAAIHAAAPCPIPVKEQMIEWWGPVIEEYYAGSEGNGMTWINSEQWLGHKGSVGLPVMGELHICDEAGNELPVGEAGTIYYGGTTPPTYHNDPDKTKDALNPKNAEWSTLGDVGRLDEDGFLYLTDRKAFMIISGGVNIYPQEAENVLITHPKVADVAVIGVPNDEFGEEVKAVVQPAEGIPADEALKEELLAYCRSQLAKIKCPKTVDFDPALPRHPTGKLYKRLVRDRYWGKTDTTIV